MCKQLNIVVDTLLPFGCVGVRKVLDSKSDLPGHSTTSVLVPFNRPHNYLLLVCQWWPMADITKFTTHKSNTDRRKIFKLGEGVTT